MYALPSFPPGLLTDWGEEESCDTCPAWWAAVHQHNISTIVMLCNVEPGYRGCSQA